MELFCCSVFNFQETMIKMFGEIDDDIIVSILIFETHCLISVGSESLTSDYCALLSSFLLRIWFFRIQDTIVCLGPLVLAVLSGLACC